MEMIPFENAIRTEWKTRDRKKLFQSLLSFFPQLTTDDKSQISEQIDDDNIGYLEVPHYENSNENSDPKMLLVFQGKRVFIDILNPLHKAELMAKLHQVIDAETKFVKSRDMTLAEWKKRLQIMLQLVPAASSDYEDTEDDSEEELYADDFFDDYDFSIPCDEEGHLKRSAFQLVAKQPAVDWANEAEIKFHKDEKQRINWDVKNINAEPAVFLGPSCIELKSTLEQKRIWAKLKERAFYNFVESFYVDDDYWPEITQKLFNEWFDITPLGSVIDIADDL